MPFLVFNPSQDSVTLKRACKACIKAKRRCDRQVPVCSRCSSRSLSCEYVNEPLPSNSGSLPATNDRPVEKPSVPDKALKQSSTLDIIPGSFTDSLSIDFSTGTYGSHYILRADPSVQEYVLSIDFETFDYLVEQMKQFPLMNAKSGKTPFSRRDVFALRMPRIVDEVHALCAAFQQCSRVQEQRLVALAIDHSLQKMVLKVRPDLYPFQDYQDVVVSLQALIIALTVLVFYAGPEAQDRARRFEKPLKLWSTWLWKHAPSQLSSDMNLRQAFVVGEGIRRTILMSNTFLMVWQVAREGVFRHGVFVDALPFDARTWLFDGVNAADGTWQADYRHGWDEPHKLLSYHEFTGNWERHGFCRPPSIFEEILLVACKGRRRVQSRTPSPQFNQ